MIEKYNIKGRVVNHRTKEPIKYVTVLLKQDGESSFYTVSDNNGFYDLECELDMGLIAENLSVLELEYAPPVGSKYDKESYTPTTLRGELKLDIPPIELQSKLRTEADAMVTKLSKIPSNVIKNVKDRLTSKEAMEGLYKNAIDKIFKTMIPIVSGLLLEFGIKKLNDKKKQCPTQTDILTIIKRRNNTVNGLNQLYRSLDVITKAYTAGLVLIKVFKMVKKLKINLPIPIFNGTPQSRIHIKQELIDKVGKDIEKYEGISATTMTYVFILRGLIVMLLGHLRNLDDNIKDCFEVDPSNPLGFESYLDPVLEEIKLLYEEVKDENDEPIRTFHNGFEIKVINVENNSVQGLFRRQAVALNPQQIIVLRGEPSFSSNDEILKNELIFYININQLKVD